MPLVLLAQIGILGLRPALAEERHLERSEERLQVRYERVAERQHELQEILRAQSDPVYQERERRLWRAPVSANRR